MSWIIDVLRFRHDMFIAFIECQINNRGNWESVGAGDDRTGHKVLRAVDNSEYNTVTVIEPDGLRRMFLFGQGSSLSMYQNVLSYQAGQAKEIIVDEKEKSGKGKTRDVLGS